jgi:hypothetical protein
VSCDRRCGARPCLRRGRVSHWPVCPTAPRTSTATFPPYVDHEGIESLLSNTRWSLVPLARAQGRARDGVRGLGFAGRDHRVAPRRSARAPSSGRAPARGAETRPVTGGRTAGPARKPELLPPPVALSRSPDRLRPTAGQRPSRLHRPPRRTRSPGRRRVPAGRSALRLFGLGKKTSRSSRRSARAPAGAFCSTGSPSTAIGLLFGLVGRSIADFSVGAGTAPVR